MQAVLLAALLLAAGVAPAFAAAISVTAQDTALTAFPQQAPGQFVGVVCGSKDAAEVNGCPAGTHHPVLRTYILSVPRFAMRAAASGSDLHELRVKLADAPPVMPIIVNRGPGHGLQQGLLDTRRFLADWAQVSAEAPGGITLPSVAVDRQCGGTDFNASGIPGGKRRFAVVGGYEEEGEGHGAPSNAMLLLHGPRKASAVVDVEGLRLEGDEVVATVRWVRRIDTIPENAGCHRTQSRAPAHRHYHHQATCGYDLLPGDSRGQDMSAPVDMFMASASGLTAFLKGRAESPPPSPSPPPPPPPPPPPSPSPPPPSPSPPPPSPSPPPPSPSPPPPKPFQPPPRPSPPSPKPPPPPVVREASGYTDEAYVLLFKGFDRTSFAFKGTAGSWQGLLGSASQAFNLRTKFAPAALNPYAKLPTMRSVEWRLGGTTVLASVLPPTGSGGTWRLAVTANGQAVVGSVALPGGVTVRLTTFAPAANGVKARVTINAGFMRVTLSQRWRERRNQARDFLNIAIMLEGRYPLQLPVTGLLGPSYKRTLPRR